MEMVSKNTFVTTVMFLLLMSSQETRSKAEECQRDPDPRDVNELPPACPEGTNILEACYKLNCYDARVCKYRLRFLLYTQQYYAALGADCFPFHSSAFFILVFCYNLISL